MPTKGFTLPGLPPLGEPIKSDDSYGLTEQFDRLKGDIEDILTPPLAGSKKPKEWLEFQFWSHKRLLNTLLDIGGQMRDWIIPVTPRQPILQTPQPTALSDFQTTFFGTDEDLHPVWGFSLGIGFELDFPTRNFVDELTAWIVVFPVLSGNYGSNEGAYNAAAGLAANCAARITTAVRDGSNPWSVADDFVPFGGTPPHPLNASGFLYFVEGVQDESGQPKWHLEGTLQGAWSRLQIPEPNENYHVGIVSCFGCEGYPEIGQRWLPSISVYGPYSLERPEEESE